jgi:hypothetical protein
VAKDDGWENLTQAQARRRALGLPPEAPVPVSRPVPGRRRHLGLAERTSDGLRSAGPLFVVWAPEDPQAQWAARARRPDYRHARPPRPTHTPKGGWRLPCGHHVSRLPPHLVGLPPAAVRGGFMSCPVCRKLGTLS